MASQEVRKPGRFQGRAGVRHDRRFARDLRSTLSAQHPTWLHLGLEPASPASRLRPGGRDGDHPDDGHGAKLSPRHPGGWRGCGAGKNPDATER
jgi:hypothetical protein